MIDCCEAVPEARPKSKHDAERLTRMTPSRRIILDCLVENDRITSGQLIDELYGWDENGGPDDPHGVIRFHMFYLRRLLARHDVTITYRPGIGYRIPDDGMRARARAVLDAGNSGRHHAIASASFEGAAA